MRVLSLQDPTQKVTLQGGMIRIFFKIRDEKLEGNPAESGPSEDAEEKPVRAGRAGASAFLLQGMGQVPVEWRGLVTCYQTSICQF